LRDLSLPTRTLPSLDRAGIWFLSSGIQEANGGVARYHLADTRRNLPVSTEITGYAASAFAYLYRRTGEEAYLAAAGRAARFLTRSAWDAELDTIPFEVTTPPSPAYFFDCGIIVRGLLAVYRLTGDAEYLDTARKCGLAMGRDFRAGVDLHPILTLPSKEPLPYEARWSRSPGCYQLKSAMAWDDLYLETRESQFLEWYEAALERALATHASFLPGDEDSHRVMDRLHAYSYFLEGALPRLERPAVRAAIEDGTRNAAELLRAIAPDFERSDVCGQLLRVRLYAAGAMPIDMDAAEDEAMRCESYQLPDGGFTFGSKAGVTQPFFNPVSTAFCMQAIEMWRQFRAGEFHGDRHELI
jgi:hypothetical protein